MTGRSREESFRYYIYQSVFSSLPKKKPPWPDLSVRIEPAVKAHDVSALQWNSASAQFNSQAKKSMPNIGVPVWTNSIESTENDIIIIIIIHHSDDMLVRARI